MSGEEVAKACQQLETAVYECLARSSSIGMADMHTVLNLLSGKLRAKSDQLREAQGDASDEDVNSAAGWVLNEVNYG